MLNLRRAIAWPVMLMIATAALMVDVSPAQADPSCAPRYDEYGSLIGYENCEDGGSGGDGGNDGGSDGGLSCDLTPEPPSWGEPPYTFCEGATACTYERRPSGWENHIGEGHGTIPPRPSPDHVLATKWCRAPGASGPTSLGDRWIDDSAPELGPPSLAEQARRAYGSLAVPEFALEFGPVEEAIVGAQTFFWITGPGTGQIVGTPAFTLVAVGVPSHIEIRPGNGDPAFTCPWTLRQTTTCAKQYLTLPHRSRLVDDKPQRSYDVETTIVYDVHFEPLGGGPALNIPGLDGELLSIEDSVTTPVPVGEIQPLVTRR